MLDNKDGRCGWNKFKLEVIFFGSNTMEVGDGRKSQNKMYKFSKDSLIFRNILLFYLSTIFAFQYSITNLDPMNSTHQSPSFRLLFVQYQSILFIESIHFIVVPSPNRILVAVMMTSINFGLISWQNAFRVLVWQTVTGALCPRFDHRVTHCFQVICPS